MDDRIFNFSAGPAVLPEEVLLKAQNLKLDCANFTKLNRCQASRVT